MHNEIVQLWLNILAWSDISDIFDLESDPHKEKNFISARYAY